MTRWCHHPILGQINLEAMHPAGMWAEFSEAHKAEWEAAAQAVRAAVIEEVAKACEVNAEEGWTNIGLGHYIRSLK